MARDDTTDREQLLERQRQQVEDLFAGLPTGPPRVFTKQNYDEARRLAASGGGWTGLHPALIQAVRDGARPGDEVPLPPSTFDIVGIDNADVKVVDRFGERAVALVFAQRAPPRSPLRLALE